MSEREGQQGNAEVRERESGRGGRQRGRGERSTHKRRATARDSITTNPGCAAATLRRADEGKEREEGGEEDREER